MYGLQGEIYQVLYQASYKPFVNVNGVLLLLRLDLKKHRSSERIESRRMIFLEIIFIILRSR